MQTIVAGPLDSPARVRDGTRPPLVVGLVQTRWHADADEHATVLADGVASAAAAGAAVVFLPELTLLRYPAAVWPDAGPGSPGRLPSCRRTRRIGARERTWSA